MLSGRKRLLVEIVAFFAVLALVFFLTRRARGPESFQESHVAMGTVVSVTVFAAAAETALAAIDVAYDEVRRIEELTTRYSSQSEVARLNARGGGRADPEVVFVLARALAAAEASGGAFDPTVGPLVDLWDFGEDMVLPDHGAILEALGRVGYRAVSVDTVASSVALPGGAAIDLDGIAKGHAVDSAIEALAAMGIESALVDAGGDIRLLGRGPRAGEWLVGIKHPRVEGLVGVLRLEGGSVATSGDYQRCGFVGDDRYHHILNPRTGYPVRGVVSATVTCERCIDADALATAVFVMGPRDGMAFIEATDGVEGVIVSGDNEIEEVLVSSGLVDRFDDAR